MWRAARQSGFVWAAAVLLLAGSAWTQARRQNWPSPASVVIVTDVLPEPIAHTPYHFQLVARGGTPPYTWQLEKGKLPPGLHLDAKAGTITGMPQAAEELVLTVQVSDSAEPAHVATREVKARAVPALQMEWLRHPALENDGIYGAVKVANPGKDPYDLTFIIVAVNEIGKAFALGYQHFTLRPKAEQEISFGSSLPLGTYIVHADAVGEIAAKDVIRRARLQTPEPLVKK
ncbi:MAG: Ig domain-containing protein [Chlamydiota bacterium]